MAGTIYTAYRNYTRFYMSWSLAEQNIAGNSSRITWEIGVQGQPGYTAYWYSNAIRIESGSVNGEGTGGGTYSNITLANGASRALRSGSTWIGHNPDGGKAFGMSVSGWLYNNGTVSSSGSWNLPTIPRNSQVTTNAASYTLGDPIQVNTNRKSGSFTHAITIRLHNSGGTVLETINNVNDSTTWTPSPSQITAIQNAIPSSNQLTLYVDQYNNQVGANSATTVTLNLTDANPTYSDFTFLDSSTATVAITGSNQILVKGKSTLKVDISSANKMVANKGATATRYTVAYDGTSEQKDYSSSALVTASFTNPQTIGSRTILVTASDSRNNSTTVSKSITVYDYADPTISTKLTRENNFDNNTTVHIEGTYTPLVIGGANKNNVVTGSLQYRYQEEGGSFNSWVTKTYTANTTDGTFTVTDFVISLNNQKKYNFEFKVADKFGTITTTNIVDVGTPIMFIGQNNGATAVSIGSMPVAGSALTINGVSFESMAFLAAHPVGTIYTNKTDSRNPGSVWGGTWNALAGRVIVGKATSGTFSTAGATMGSETHSHGSGSYQANMEIFTTGGTFYIDFKQSNTVGYQASIRRRVSGGAADEGNSETQDSGVQVGGTSSVDTTIQPSLVAYMWERTA
jgi:hypothetical protein